MKYAITEVGVLSYRAVADDFDPADLAENERLVDALPQEFLDRMAAAELLASQTAQLNALTRQANAQVSALAGRVSTLDYLINGQDEEDPDYMAPTAAEIAELPQRKTQLKAWNTYTVKLGRVTGAAGWPATPTWPVMPEPYTSETSALSAPTE